MNNVEQKKVVSDFEFAITEFCDPEAAKSMRPRTRAEENEHRLNSILPTIEKLKTLDGRSITKDPKGLATKLVSNS